MSKAFLKITAVMFTVLMLAYSILCASATNESKYKITVALYNIELSDKVTVSIVNTETEEKTKVVFTEDESFRKQLLLPPGEYTISKLNSDDWSVKVSANISNFTVSDDNPYQNCPIDCTENQLPRIVRFLRRNAVFIVMLIGLVIALNVINKRKTVMAE